ncbi:MAG: putative type modification methyltransferase [Bacteroidetes bacterium]|nr:putative type modification methyltransferase [Bacteroidota bacterium]
MYPFFREDMPTLHWIGKEKIINHHLEVPYRVLNHHYNFTGKNTVRKRSSQDNMIIHGDNLEALKSLLPKYEGKVNCIYIDPPYNTGNEGWTYNDNVNHPKIKKWLEKTLSAHTAGKDAGIGLDDLTRHDKWLCMIYPRLALLHKLLAPDGVIFISIDDNEVAHLKIVLDEIFGANNFLATFYWKRTSTPPSLSNVVRKKLEPLICYQKTDTKKQFNGGNSEGGDMPLLNAGNALTTLNFGKENIFFKVKDGIYRKGIYDKTTLLEDIEIANGQADKDILLQGNFKWTQDTLTREISEGTRFFVKSEKFSVRYQRDGERIKTPSNIVSKEECNIETNEDAAKQIEHIFGDRRFSFPKPASLIQYLINFMCDKNSVILDSFAGSGTTAEAVLNLNKLDDGNRKFILIEMEDYAESITAERVKRTIDGYSGKEGTNGSFDFYSLGATLFDEENNLNEEVETEKIREYIWFNETRKPYKISKSACLGMYNNTGYYFLYNKEEATSLDYSALAKHVKTKAEYYIVYADKCLLPESFMQLNNIEFKKIPRDITRF